MNGLGVELRTHGVWREAFCLICGGLHEQECVAAVLVRGGEAVGDLCSRCLAEGPARGGERLRERATRMSGRAEAVSRRGGSRVLADVVRDRAKEWLGLAEELRAVPAWGVTPEDVRCGERAALRERFPQVPGQVLSRLVDARHARQLAAARAI